MTHDWLQGAWAAMPTPWSADGRIDSGIVAELVSRYLAAGLNGVYTTGTDGEMHVLDMYDFRSLVDAFSAVTIATGLPAQVGCTWHHTDGVIERARYASEHGIARVQIALPSWITLSDYEMLSFFEAIQIALPDLEIIHYNIASSGRFLTGKDYRAILDVAPNLRGSKHTGGNVASLIEIVQATPELRHFVVDQQIVPGALFGAKGFYSFVANLNPIFTAELWRNSQLSDLSAAAAQRVLLDNLFREWLALCPEITASPALAKIATRAGIFPDMPLAARAPYRSGEERHVQELRDLIAEKYPQLAM